MLSTTSGKTPGIASSGSWGRRWPIILSSWSKIPLKKLSKREHAQNTCVWFATSSPHFLQHALVWLESILERIEGVLKNLFTIFHWDSPQICVSDFMSFYTDIFSLKSSKERCVSLHTATVVSDHRPRDPSETLSSVNGTADEGIEIQIDFSISSHLVSTLSEIQIVSAQSWHAIQ